MSGITNAQLASQVSSLVSTWRAREAQYKAWIGGTADGGPEGDGRYPLTDGKGLTYMVESPARLRDMVSGPAALAIAAKDAIAQTEAVVLAEGARVDTVAAGVDANRRAALDARDQAQLAREVVQGIEARVLQYRNEALGAREGTLADLTQVQELAEDVVYQTGLAENAAFDAIAAADRAATFDPAQYAPVSHQHTWDQITGKPLTFTPSAHGHAWGEITGKPSVFTPAAHTHLWADITDKPTTFAPSAHSHAWTEITGKPTSFTPSAHGHTWAEISGKPATYAPDAHGHTWDQITGKPTTFTPSAHSHPEYASASDAVTLSATNLGRTGAGPLQVVTEDILKNAATGYSVMTAPGSATPLGTYGYLFKHGRRDGSNGYSALWTSHGGDFSRLFIGGTDGPGNAVWSEVWTNRNFDPASKANASHTHPWSQITGAPAVTGLTPAVGHSGATLVQRSNEGYVFLNYLNTTDNWVGSGVTGLVCKQGDDFHRTANADAVRGFLGLGSAAYANTWDFASAGALGGKMDRAVNTWITTSEGYPRFHFSANGRSYYRSADGHEWRNNDDVNIMWLGQGGDFWLPYNFQSTSTSGYVRIPGTPFILQWGEVAAANRGEGAAYIPFNTAFPNACLNVQAHCTNPNSNNSYDSFMQKVSLTAYGANMYLQSNSSGARLMGIAWFAIGY